MGQGANIITLSSDSNTGNLVFDLKAPISLSLNSNSQSVGSIGFVLRDVYSEVKGPAVEVFTGAVSMGNTLRVYIPSQNFVGSTAYGTWGTRSNTGGIVNSRDFFGSISLAGADGLSAGDQIFLLPGRVTLSHNAATLLPDTLNNSTQIQLFNQLDSSALSVMGELGASSQPLPETKMSAPVVTSTGVELRWTGPGLLMASPDLASNLVWDYTQNPDEFIKPPFFILFRDLQGGSRDRYFFRMAIPWSVGTQNN
jgi:hypothetical protein